MPFSLVPVEAYRVDISEVEDVERERLRIKFLDGIVLYFRIAFEDATNEPRSCLVLDPSQGADGERLTSQLRERFLHNHADKNGGVLAIIPLFGGTKKSPYLGWSWERLHSSFEVTIEMGQEGPTGTRFSGHGRLQVREIPVVMFGIRGDRYEYSLLTHGPITAIDSYTVPAVSAAPPALRG